MKTLKIKTWASRSKRGKWHVRIEEQSHRMGEFSTIDSEFKAHNGITLRSITEPEWLPEYNILYVRGDDDTKDFKTLTVTADNASLIQEAVDEYNLSFATTPIINTRVELGNGEYFYENIKITCSNGNVIVSRAN